MAITLESVSNQTMTFGKGKDKRDVVIVGLHHKIPSTDADPVGVYLNYEMDTGATTDDPFGLRIISMQYNVTNDVAFAVTKFASCAFGVMAAPIEDQASSPANLASTKLIEAMGTTGNDTLQMGDALLTTYMSQRELRPEFSRQFVLSKLYLGGQVASSSGQQVHIYQRYVFEKVKLTKNEYLEKAIRNL